MKRLVLLMILVCTIQIIQAQVNDHAIGFRGGFGGGISYQHGFNDINRGEVDLAVGIGNYALYLRTALAYHWVIEVSNGLNVFIGPSASVGIQYIDSGFGNADDGLFILLGGQAGLDYNFQDFPFQLSLDIMPQAGVLNSNEDFYLDPAFAVRYVF